MISSQKPKASQSQFQVAQKDRLQAFPRANVQGEVIIHDDSQLYIAPLNDISAGGLFVNDLVFLSEGSQVRIVVKSPKFETAVQAVGTIVRVEGEKRRGLAVEFTSISSRSREVIQNCVFESRMESALKVV